MAITASGLFVSTWIDVFDNTQLPLDLTATTHKIALYNNTYTPNYSSSGAYTTANEVSGVGWAAGGVPLSAAANGASTSPTLTELTPGSMVWDMGDVSVANTTLTGIRGCLIYADALAGKNGIVFINFGSDYQTQAGTFGISWSTSGLYAVDLTP